MPGRRVKPALTPSEIRTGCCLRAANVVVLEPDVARVFSNAPIANDSIRALAGILRR